MRLLWGQPNNEGSRISRLSIILQQHKLAYTESWQVFTSTQYCDHTRSMGRFQVGCEVGQVRGELRLDDFERQGRERADEVADLASLAVLCGDRFLEEGIGHQVAFQLRLRLGGVATQHEGKPRLDP